MAAKSPARTHRAAIAFSLLGIALLVLIALNICIGSVPVPLERIPQILGSPGDMDTDTLTGIVWKIRLPRLIGAAMLGGALALSGFLLQTFFSNPIAGPYILGVSSGAKLMVSILLIVVMGAGGTVGSAGMIGGAFFGALLSMGLVLLLARNVPRASMLIVCGVMIGYICSAVTDFLITFASDASIVNLQNWSRGSFSALSWSDVGGIAGLVPVVSIAVFLLAKPIRAYMLGEAYAQSMGVPIRRFRILLVLLASLLSACVTAYAGPVSFVGIAAPHVASAMLRTSKPMLVIPASFLCGSVFCLLCDLIARTVLAPNELAIGSVTAVFGAPIVIAVMVRKRKGDAR